MNILSLFSHYHNLDGGGAREIAGRKEGQRITQGGDGADLQ